MAKISPFVKLLRGEYELTVLAVLTQVGGKARADKIIKAGKKTKTLPTLNGARVAKARKFLLKHELIKVKKEGHEIIHSLTPRGRKLGKLLNNIFINLHWLCLPFLRYVQLELCEASFHRNVRCRPSANDVFGRQPVAVFNAVLSQTQLL